MTCADVQRVLPEVMENAPDGEFEAHLKACPACSELVSDLKLISSEGRQLAESDEPAPRVWVRIAAELRSEGLIREQEPVAALSVPAPTKRRRWNAWWLVPIAAALVVAGSYLVSQKPVSPVPVAGGQAPNAQAPTVQAPVVPPPQTASAKKNQKNLPETVETTSAEDEQFLSEVSERAPTMRATYENQLRAVNSYIREAQAYVDQNPGDEDARQALMEAYQQKAMLYQIALDRIQ